MRFLKRVLIGLIFIIAVAAATSYTQPRYVTVERSIDIAAPPADVFVQVNSLQNGADWSPWLALDPETELTYDGPESGVGNSMTWASENPSVGRGSQEIVESLEDQRVETAMSMEGMNPGRAWFDLEETSTGTTLTWGLEADMGNSPIGRWVGAMMDGLVGADFEAGLANIRDLVEG